MTNNIETVRTTFGNLKHMQHPQAMLMRDFIIEQDARNILEIGSATGSVRRSETG
jgi:hypothetical protein